MRRSTRIVGFLALGFAALLLGAVALTYRGDIPAAELEARYADADSRFLEVAGSRVHFKDSGSPDDGDPTLLLIHGTASSLHTWDGWAAQLGDRFRLLRLDLPGYGLTGANAAGEGGRGDYSIAYRLDILDALLEARGVRRAVVAGNSLGGLIAWRYAAERPERVVAVVLVNAAGAPRPDAARDDGRDAGFRAIDLASMPVVSTLMTRLTPRFLVRDALHQVYGDPSKVDDALIDRHYELLLREGSRRAMVEAAAQRGGGSAPGVGPDRVRQPTLVLWGGEDRWIPVADAARFDAALPDSELIVYPNAGHVPMEEIPVQTARDVEEFLSRRVLVAAVGQPAETGSGAAGDALAVPRQAY